ncbi:MAG TPA: galactokinase [Candidatus Limnocylindrales bacterium]|nr:galactokinase [Candidatus Limnocylindrales bacterium]
MTQAHAARRRAIVGRLEGMVGSSIPEHKLRVVRAPGRVNLIGEHTDYNLGFVLPVAISLETWVASVPADDLGVELLSLEAGDRASFALREPGPARGSWIDYVAGVAWSLAEQGVTMRGLRGVIDSEIPLGSGLSSSAALEVAAAWTLADGTPPLRPMDLARAAQRAENLYVGVQCGLMDQFASTHGRAGHALLLDCRSLEHRPVPLPAGHSLVAIDTRTPHRLGTSEYNARREQCERGVAVIARRHPAVESLRDVTPEMLGTAADLLEEETMRRCRHVVTENQRVLAATDALEAGDLNEVGRLLAESHASLRDDYEVSSAELDALVEIASAVDGVIGARMTGAGFGGCTVNLVRDDAIDTLRVAVERDYSARTGLQAGFYVVRAVDGAGEVVS